MKIKMKWYFNLKKKFRLLITLVSWLPSVVYANLTQNSESTVESIIFITLLSIGIFFTTIYFKAIRSDERKNSSKSKDNSLYQDRITVNEQQDYLYKELISNDYSVREDLSNFESNIIIAALRQLHSNPLFDPNDIDFDVFKRISELQSHAYNKMSKSKKGSFISVDIETTGLDYNTERIIQLSAVKVIDYQIVDTFSTYINPKKRILVSATDVHGITNDVLLGMPTIKEVFPKFEDFIENYDLIMHNSAFDYTFLRKEYLRVNKKAFNRQTYCTMKLWRKKYEEYQHDVPASSKLCHVAAILLDPDQLMEYNINQHDALTDAIAAARIYMKMI